MSQALPPLEREALMGAAAQMLGVDDFGSDFEAPLDVLLEDMRTTAGLNEIGVAAQVQDVLRLLINRLGFERDKAAHPEILEQELEPPIVILGLPRTGTSKLQRTIAADPGMQRLEVWRLLSPAPMGPGDPDPRIALGEQLEGMLPLAFQAIHPMEAREPDEDLWLMELTFEAYVPSHRLHLPNHRAFVGDRQDHAYTYMRDVLKYLQWQDGGARGRPWVMKSPMHIGQVAILHALFPGATFVQLHRDPRTVLGSYCSLIEIARGMNTDDVDLESLGPDFARFWGAYTERNLDARKTVAGLEIYDVGYEQVRDDIDGVIAEIYRRAGREITDDARAAFADYGARRPQTHFGVHQYDPDRWGVTPELVRESFAAYLDEFPELDPMTTMDNDLPLDPRVHEPELWAQLTAAIGDMRDIWATDPRADTPLLEAEGTRYLTRLIAAGIPVTMEAWDFEHPFLVKFLSPYLQFGIPSADTIYHWSAVHGDGVYRIRGKRGSAHLFDVEARKGHTSHLAEWELVDRKSDFHVEDDGTIEVVLSATEQPGNWVRIAEGPGVLIVRQYFYDWDTEESFDLVIERDGATYPPAPLQQAQVGERLELLIAWIRKVGAACRFAVNEYYEAEPGTLKFVNIDFAWADLQYGKGTYTCARDEAVILEVTPPNAAYWQYQLTSHFWEALDYNLRQTSLNGFQATLDDDGVFRAVIAHEDPGVANWLDAGGHTTGLITARYYKADSTIGPAFKTVPLAEVRDHLPAGTTLVDAATRQDHLKARARSMFRRRA